MLLENSNKSFQISFERTGVFVYVHGLYAPGPTDVKLK